MFRTTFSFGIFLFVIVFFLVATPTLAAPYHTTALTAAWYDTNQSIQWEELTIAFDQHAPVGRLTIAAVELDSMAGLSGTQASALYQWQFIGEPGIDSLITVVVHPDRIESEMYYPYILTSGQWVQVPSVQQSDGSVRFHIQSNAGSLVVMAVPDITNTTVSASDESPTVGYGAFVDLPISAAALVTGYTAETPKKDIRVGLMPQIVDRPFTAKIREINTHPSKYSIPDGLTLASDIYHVWLDGGVQPLTFSRPLPIEIQFPTGNDELKNIYYYDPVSDTWHPSPSVTMYDADSDTAQGYVRTATYQQELIVAVLADPAKKEWGLASWYPSSLTKRNTLGSANNDYPNGTILRVTNLVSGEYFDTERISSGPYVDHRIIDLASDAFEKIASLGAGVIRVKIEPVTMIMK